MTHHARHRASRRARHRARSPRRALLVLATTATAATGTLLGSAGSASADVLPERLGAGSLAPLATNTLSHSLGTLAETTGHAVGPVLDLQLDPLANTSADPLDNAAGTKIADFPPLTTAALTGPLTDGASARELPEALLGGPLGGLLGGAGPAS